jgi:hypothetical protein
VGADVAAVGCKTAGSLLQSLEVVLDPPGDAKSPVGGGYGAPCLSLDPQPKGC